MSWTNILFITPRTPTSLKLLTMLFLSYYLIQMNTDWIYLLIYFIINNKISVCIVQADKDKISLLIEETLHTGNLARSQQAAAAVAAAASQQIASTGNMSAMAATCPQGTSTGGSLVGPGGGGGGTGTCATQAHLPPHAPAPPVQTTS